MARPSKWIKSSEKDLEAARYNKKGENYSLAAFLCQQSAEKALKHLYITKNEENLQTHNLVRLARELEAPERIRDICSELSQLYIETRYPDSLEKFSKAEVSNFVEKAEEVVEWTKKQ